MKKLLFGFALLLLLTNVFALKDAASLIAQDEVPEPKTIMARG